MCAIPDSVIRSRAMENLIDDDDVEIVPIALDAATRAWLNRIAREARTLPTRVAAAILHDVRVDDEAAHSLN